MFKMFKISTLSIAVLTALTLTACNNDNNDVVNPAVAAPLEVTLLHVNDSHSHLDEETTNLNLETAAATTESIKVQLGGFARVVGFINQVAATEKNVIKIHAGDALTGDLYYTTLGEGKVEAAMMNSVCFDTMTLGNHEFDNQDAGLKKFIDFLNNNDSTNNIPVCTTKTQVLSANTNFGSSSLLYKSDLVKPYTIIEKEGQKIALIGLTVAGKTKTSSRPNADTTFSDELTTAQHVIDTLKKQGINKIIIQSHVGYDVDLDLAAKLSGVDVIVGGDSHTLVGDDKLKRYGLTPQGNYPTIIKNKDGQNTCVVTAWQYAYDVGQLKVNFDKDGNVTACSGQANILLGDSFKRADAKGAALTTTEIDSIKKDIANSNALRIVQPDVKTLSVLAPYSSAKVLLGQQKVAITQTNLCLRRVPGKSDTSRSTLGDVCNKDSFINAHGGDVQQLVAEAFLQQGKKYFGADLSIQNGGGVRVDLPIGDTTVDKIYSVLPFKNTLVELHMTGQEVKNALEDGLDGVIANKNSGGYPYSGGLRWDIDMTKAKGQRLSNMQVRDSSGQYQTLDMAKTYKVVTINFLADGGDFYSTLATIKGNRRVEVGLDYAEAFLKYVDNLPTQNGTKVLSRVALNDYSTQNFKE